MKRGDLISVRKAGGAVSNARPCLFVQTDAAGPDTPKVTVALLTSIVDGRPLIRPTIVSTSQNGLRQVSDVEVGRLFSPDRGHVGGRFGTLDPVDVQRVDAALRRWLNL